MKHYNHYSLTRKRNKKMITDWAYKEGIFLSPNGKYIARVRNGRSLTTISQHLNIEDAQKAYNDFYNNSK